MFVQQINTAIIIIIIVECTLAAFLSPFLCVLGTKTTNYAIQRGYNNTFCLITSA